MRGWGSEPWESVGAEPREAWCGVGTVGVLSIREVTMLCPLWVGELLACLLYAVSPCEVWGGRQPLSAAGSVPIKAWIWLCCGPPFLLLGERR